MKPGDYQGYTPNATNDAAMTAFLVKHPEEIGAKLEIHRDDGCILIRRRQDGRRAVNELDRDRIGDCPGDSVSTE
uniref:Uncharacterized protein n=1 Tax=viral metagenome TaxID=1070528 RepID=A0A6H1ZC21_9ZZZZ